MEEKNFLIYKSSAGSGKTSALIRVFLELALGTESPSYFKRLLAVTFTNKAANEMKERFLAELNRLAHMDDDYATGGNYMTDALLKSTGLEPSELKRRAIAVFEMALQDYGEIGISTIDRFNHKLIRSFSRDLHLKSDFEVEMEATAFFRDVVLQLLEEVEEGSFLARHLESFIAGRLDSDKKPSVQNALEGLRPLVMSDEGREPMRALADVDETKFAEWRKIVRDHCRHFENQCGELADRVFELLESQGLTVKDLAQKSSGWYGYFKKLKTIRHQKDKVVLHRGIKNHSTWAPKSLKGERRNLLDGIQPELSEAYDRASHLIETEHGLYLRSRNLSTRMDLLALLSRLNEAAELLKDERNILPISEFNHLISEAIRNEPVAFIYENYGGRFHHILIDEFQDTGELQWKNMIPLIEESLSRGHRNLVVGDAKQSIYRWRGGKAEQLIRLPELDPDDPKIDPGVRDMFRRSAHVEPLNTNYRSLPRIVEFNNVFIANLGRILLNDELYLKEYAADNVHQKSPPGKKGGFVEIRFLGKKPERHEYGDALVEQIETARRMGYDYGDMAILVRGRKEGDEIVRILPEDVPFTTADSFGLDQNAEVEGLVSMMRLSVDPSEAPAKIRVMRTLANLHGIPFRPRNFKRRLKGEKQQDIDFEKFVRTIRPDFSMGALRGKGAFDLCRYTVSHLFPEDRRHDIFIRSFINLVFKREGTRGGAESFLSWWDGLKLKPTAARGPVGNRVQIQTIHKSKGLQYRVCFLPYMDWKYTLGSDLRWFEVGDLHENFIPYAPLPTSTSALESMGMLEESQREDEETHFDNLNLIYVAATRAEEQLYLSYGSSSKDRVGQALHEAMNQVDATVDEFAGSWTKRALPLDEKEDDADPAPSAPHSDKDEHEDSPVMWHYGVPTSAEEGSDSTEEDSAVLPRVAIADSDIDERFRLGDDNLTRYRDMGIRFHDLIIHGPHHATVIEALDRQIKNGEVDREMAGELRAMVEALYADPDFTATVAGTKWLSEREVVFEGRVLRPDLILDHGDKNTVIDFKTGLPRDTDREQVRRYRRALAAATGKATRAFLVYLSPLEWSEITED